MRDSESNKGLCCPNCGSILAPDAQFCTFCGFLVDLQKRDANAKPMPDFDPGNNFTPILYGPPPVSFAGERPAPKKKGFWAKLFGR